MGELTNKLVNELRRWCAKERGRQVSVSRLLGISAQGVSNLLAGRQELTGEQALVVQQLLKTQGKSTKKGKAT
jgi:predicted XRE-type DNA-binding protein